MEKGKDKREREKIEKYGEEMRRSEVPMIGEEEGEEK